MIRLVIRRGVRREGRGGGRKDGAKRERKLHEKENRVSSGVACLIPLPLLLFPVFEAYYDYDHNGGVPP